MQVCRVSVSSWLHFGTIGSLSHSLGYLVRLSHTESKHESRPAKQIPISRLCSAVNPRSDWCVKLNWSFVVWRRQNTVYSSIRSALYVVYCCLFYRDWVVDCSQFVNTECRPSSWSNVEATWWRASETAASGRPVWTWWSCSSVSVEVVLLLLYLSSFLDCKCWLLTQSHGLIIKVSHVGLFWSENIVVSNFQNAVR